MKEFLELLHTLQVALKNLQLYAESHPRCVEANDAADRAFRAASQDRDRLSVMVTRGKMFLDGKAVPPNIHANALASQLQARSLNGIIFSTGLEKSEMGVLLRVLSMKPQQLESRGGAAALLAESNVSHIRFPAVRYEEVSEGEEVVPEGLLEQGNRTMDDEGDRLIPARQFLSEVLLPLLKEMTPLYSSSGRPGESSGQDPASTSGGGSGSGSVEGGAGRDPGARLSRMNPSAASVAELLPELLTSVPGSQQGTLLLSLSGMEDGALKQGLARIAPQMLGNAVGDMVASSGTANLSDLSETLQTLLRAVPARVRGVEILRAKLDAAGMSREQVDELIELMSWEELDTDERVQKLLTGNFLFRFPTQKLTSFLQDLHGRNRKEDLLKILDRYSRGLFATAPAIRRRVADGFVNLSAADDLNEPSDVSGMIERVVFTHFLREQDQKIQLLSRAAMENLFSGWIRQRSIDHAYRNLLKIEAAVGSLAADMPWKRDSFNELLDSLTGSERIEPLIAMIRETDTESLVSETSPLVHFFGSRMAGPLLDALEQEQERSRRGRLVRTLRSLGAHAIDELRAALQSPVWYLVRNAVTVLGETGSQEVVSDLGGTLHHSDVRVKRAAVRALAKIGGSGAERELAGALHENEPSTQTEILQALISMRARGAVFDMGTILKERRAELSVRLLAADALGQLGSADGLPYLSEILRRRGRIGGEPPELRIAAADALAASGVDGAREIVTSVLESEPRGNVRDLILKSLQRARPGAGL